MLRQRDGAEFRFHRHAFNRRSQSGLAQHETSNLNRRSIVSSNISGHLPYPRLTLIKFWLQATCAHRQPAGTEHDLRKPGLAETPWPTRHPISHEYQNHQAHRHPSPRRGELPFQPRIGCSRIHQDAARYSHHIAVMDVTRFARRPAEMDSHFQIRSSARSHAILQDSNEGCPLPMKTIAHPGTCQPVMGVACRAALCLHDLPRMLFPSQPGPIRSQS